jgi:hypothetical protein
VGVYFWGLDGSHMDDDFAFSFHATREEWEAERHKWADFHRRFEEEQRAGKPAGTASVWQRSYAKPDAGDDPPALRLFGVGACLAELTLDLKDAGAGREAIDALSRAFGNLREAVQDPGGALVVPVVESMGNTLAEVADAHPDLAAKCADLERQLWTFTGPTRDDEEIPS